MPDRLAALEARVAALEARVPEAHGSTRAEEVGHRGEIGYSGEVWIDGEVSWSIRYGAADVLDLPAAPVVEVLAALGHTARLALVRRLLTGPASAAELRDAAELSSTGQLYHHLRALTAARVVTQDAKTYRIAAPAVVPVLVAVLAAADLGGGLRA